MEVVMENIKPLSKLNSRQSPWWNEETHDWLTGKGFKYETLVRRDFTFNKYEIYPSFIDFAYENQNTGILIGFINDMVYVFGWRDDDDRSGEYTLCWKFTHPGTPESIKSILKAYMIAL